MKVTLDTNILVSGTFWTGPSFRILELIDKGKIKSVLSEKIIKEYYKVISSDEIIDKVENKKLVIYKITEKIIRNSEIVDPKMKIKIVKDDLDDNKIIECAKEGKSEYIVTQDKHLLKLKRFENIVIVTPDVFLDIVRKGV